MPRQPVHPDLDHVEDMLKAWHDCLGDQAVDCTDVYGKGQRDKSLEQAILRVAARETLTPRQLRTLLNRTPSGDYGSYTLTRRVMQHTGQYTVGKYTTWTVQHNERSTR